MFRTIYFSLIVISMRLMSGLAAHRVFYKMLTMGETVPMVIMGIIITAGIVLGVVNQPHGVWIPPLVSPLFTTVRNAECNLFSMIFFCGKHTVSY